jgi:leucyl-tRNA synthetase
MIQGNSRFVYRLHFKTAEEFSKIPVFISYNRTLTYSGSLGERKELCSELKALSDQFSELVPADLEGLEFSPLHTDVNFVDGFELNINAFRQWRNGEYAASQFLLEEGKYICGSEVEKMSKSKFNTVNPNELVLKYGADTFRMYEMFLGPVEQSKPWDTKGIEGVHRFLKKLWRLFFEEAKGKVWVDEKATDAENKVLHRTIKRVEEDTGRFSFNTGVSSFMIAVNELGDLQCHKKEVLEKLLILLAPYAPHIAEELWYQLGNLSSILNAAYPKSEKKFLVETSKTYPVAFNGKTRTELNILLDASQEQVESIVLADKAVQKWLEGKTPKRIVYVKNRMINIVL